MMSTAGEKSKSRWIPSLIVVFVVFSGCGKKNNNVVTPPPCVGTQCGTPIPPGGGPFPLPGGTAPLATAIGFEEMQMLALGLTFYGDFTQTALNGLGGPTQYTGSVSASGILHVLQPMPIGYCQLIPGDYPITTVAPGQWSMMSLGNVQLQARGPGIVELSLMNNWITSAVPPAIGPRGTPFEFRLGGTIFIRSVNGMDCNNLGPIPLGFIELH